MNITTRVQLSVMMFLQFFIWGAWCVTMGTYLGQIGFGGPDIGKAYSATAWAAIISPFLVGMIADRFFATQKVLGVMHIVGAILLFYIAKVTDPGQFFWVLVLYALCYMPTLALTNSLSFHQMKNPDAEFPGIRVLGTIGWIVAGWVIDKLGIGQTSSTFMLAAGSSIVMGVFCFFLPNTPPSGAGKKITVREILCLDALKLLKQPSFAVFVIASLLICIPLAFYYNFTNMFLTELGVAEPTAKQTFGQMSEIFFMIVMPFFFIRLGVKYMLLFGMAAWAARYALFAYGNTSSLSSFLYLGILLHGICYDFFFVTGQIYTDKKAPKELRASAQGFLALMTLGLGMLIGSNVSGMIVGTYEIKDVAQKVIAHNWQSIWLIPAAMAAVILVLFALLFRDKISTEARKAD